MMAEKTEQQLQDMVARPTNWNPNALEAARAELQRRGIQPIEIAPQEVANKDYEILPNGRKRLLRATFLDIIISIILPGWGFIIGAFALLIKREKKRGATMMAIGVGVLVLIIAMRIFD